MLVDSLEAAVALTQITIPTKSFLVSAEFCIGVFESHCVWDLPQTLVYARRVLCLPAEPPPWPCEFCMEAVRVLSGTQNLFASLRKSAHVMGAIARVQALPLHAADSSLIPGTAYDPRSTTSRIPEHCQG